MQVTNLRYSKTIQSAQYEPELLEASAVLEDGDDFEKCAIELRSRVTTALGRKAVGPAVAGAKTNKTVSKADATEPSTTEAKTTTKAKTRTKKPVTYNREVKAHAKELGKILLAEFPNWKKDEELKVKAKEASTSLVGTDFMTAEGEVLPSFVEAVKEAMTAGDDL